MLVLLLFLFYLQIGLCNLENIYIAILFITNIIIIHLNVLCCFGPQWLLLYGQNQLKKRVLQNKFR